MTYTHSQCITGSLLIRDRPPCSAYFSCISIRCLSIQVQSLPNSQTFIQRTMHGVGIFMRTCGDATNDMVSISALFEALLERCLSNRAYLLRGIRSICSKPTLILWCRCSQR